MKALAVDNKKPGNHGWCVGGKKKQEIDEVSSADFLMGRLCTEFFWFYSVI